MPVERIPRREKFVIRLDDDYCEVTQISHTSESRVLINDNVHQGQNIPDTKFTLISTAKLQDAGGISIAERSVTQPLRLPKNCSLLHSPDGNRDGALAKFIEELDEGLVGLSEILPKSARREISSRFHEFLSSSIDVALGHYHRALWASLTLSIVQNVSFDHGNVQPEQPRLPTCSGCGRLIDTAHSNYMRMPCGDACHMDCIWSWPRQV